MPSTVGLKATEQFVLPIANSAKMRTKKTTRRSGKEDLYINDALTDLTMAFPNFGTHPDLYIQASQGA